MQSSNDPSPLEVEEETKSFNQKITRAIRWAFSEVFLRNVVSLGATLIIAKIIGPTAFGVVAMATIATSFLNIFQQQGIRQVLVQHKNLSPSHLDSAFWLGLSLGVSLWAIAYFSRFALADFFDEPLLVTIVPIAALVLPLQQLTVVPQAMAERKLDYKKLTKRTSIAIVLGATVGVSLALKGYGVWSLVAMQVSTQATSVLVLWSISLWRPGLAASRESLIEIWSFGINLFGSSLLEFSNRELDRLVVGSLWGSTTLGVYDLAKRITTALLNLTVTTGTRVALPILSRIKEHHEEFWAQLLVFIKWTCLLIYPVIGLAILWAPYCLDLFFGEKWQDASPYIQVLLATLFIQSIQYYLANSLIALEKPRQRFQMTFLNTLGNLIALLLTYQLGPIYMVAGQTIRAYVMFPINVNLLRRFLPILRIREIFHVVIRPAIITGIGVLSISLFYSFIGPPYAMVVTIIFAVAYYSWLLWKRNQSLDSEPLG